MKVGNQVELYGLAGDHILLGWIQDKRNNWKNTSQRGWVALPVRGVQFGLDGLSDGIYRLTWWDTISGKTTQGGLKKIRKGKLTLKVPRFTGDIAFTLSP
jgi:hypothetical protein